MCKTSGFTGVIHYNIPLNKLYSVLKYEKLIGVVTDE
jgi:hypothetical protein